LGGGLDQKKLVDEFRQRNFYTIIVDYYANPAAKQTADKHYRISTYDKAEVLRIASEERVDFVTTISTDQPILVAAYVCEKLELPFQISHEQALNITNKKYMKTKFKDYDIPTANFVLCENQDDLKKAEELRYPIIIKPVDSSGSRGVFVLQDKQNLPELYLEAVKHSQTGVVVAEEFIDGQEISVDAMVWDSVASVISITDGYKTYSEDKTPLYNQNIYPSCISENEYQSVARITQQIAKAFGIQNSPLFLQMIVAHDGVYVIEFSARIAGGSKPYFIPFATGVDIVEEYVTMLTGGDEPIGAQPQRYICALNHIYSNGGVFNGFCGQDALIKQEIMAELLQYQLPGSEVRKARNGSDRIGAFFVRGTNLTDLTQKIQCIDRELKACDFKGEDIMMHGLFTNDLRILR
jgi:phosphoribosylamine-glycine ligase